MSLEHKSTNYTYSKKRLKRKITTLTLLFCKKYIFLRKDFIIIIIIFLRGKSYFKETLFENSFRKKQIFKTVLEKSRFFKTVFYF